MDRPTIISRLRITTSVVFGVLCVALIALWVRSCWWLDYAHCPLAAQVIDPSSVQLQYGMKFGGQLSPRMLTVRSSRGRLWIRAGVQIEFRTGVFPSGWGMRSDYIGDRTPSPIAIPTWNYKADQYGKRVSVPHGFPALVFGALAAAFGIERVRFSLRTLLIVMALVAVVLGAVVAARQSYGSSQINSTCPHCRVDRLSHSMRLADCAMDTKLQLRR